MGCEAQIQLNRSDDAHTATVFAAHDSDKDGFIEGAQVLRALTDGTQKQITQQHLNLLQEALGHDVKKMDIGQYRHVCYVLQNMGMLDNKELLYFLTNDRDMDMRLTPEECMKAILPLRLMMDLEKARRVVGQNPVTFEQFRKIVATLRQK